MSRSEPAPAGPDLELTDYERRVLAAWTETHKKSTLMLFILLALSEEPRWSGQIREFITELSEAYLAVDEQSMHRALRRVEGLNLITHSQESVSGTGAKRKIYELTASGERVLAGYLHGPMAYMSTKLFRDATAAARRVQPS
ncbi:PadR family transcriptional regulator [Arthrobacter sp. ZGTC412]|uniref:PadR family transcriptional regulator n=1 Tax=Arthrobacter sp. ZGTC412 TaxID=2058900 RepID=UPI0015E3EB80|nr:helix-turn-helix transcriptional regulator [Arthrobacter sp. ZGTC412]